MKILFLLITGLLSTIVSATVPAPTNCPPPKRGVVCVVNRTGHVHTGAEIEGIYMRDADVDVETTDAACQKVTRNEP